MFKTFTIALFYLLFLMTDGKEDKFSTGPQYKNVLFISIDDLRPELGSYSNTMVKTPNLDRLAAGGSKFRT